MTPSEDLKVGSTVVIDGKEEVVITSVETQKESPDLGAATPAPEKPTSKMIGEWRARNFTVRHSIVLACGHKLDMRHFPRHSNCFDCWYAFLESNPEGVSSVYQLLLNQGIQAVTAMHGSKFSKMFGQYLKKKLLDLHQRKLKPQPEPAEELQVFDVTKENGNVENLHTQG